MTFGELVLALLVGGGLTALGGLAQAWIQSRMAIRQATREKRRTWDAECIGVLTDLNLMSFSLRATSLAEIPLTDIDTIQEKWRCELIRAVTRIKVGHPDRMVRLAARELEGTMVIALALASKAVEADRQDLLKDPSSPLRPLFDATQDALWLFQVTVLGPDADKVRVPTYSPTLAKHFDGLNVPSQPERSR